MAQPARKSASQTCGYKLNLLRDFSQENDTLRGYSKIKRRLKQLEKAYQVGGNERTADHMDSAVSSHNVAEDDEGIRAASGADVDICASIFCRLFVHLLEH